MEKTQGARHTIYSVPWFEINTECLLLANPAILFMCSAHLTLMEAYMKVASEYCSSTAVAKTDALSSVHLCPVVMYKQRLKKPIMTYYSQLMLKKLPQQGEELCPRTKRKKRETIDKVVRWRMYTCFF